MCTHDTAKETVWKSCEETHAGTSDIGLISRRVSTNASVSLRALLNSIMFEWLDLIN